MKSREKQLELRMLQDQRSIYKIKCILYAINEQSEIKIQKTAIYNNIKNINYLGIKLTKDVQKQYTENCKILMIKFFKYLNKWRDTLCLWVRR